MEISLSLFPKFLQPYDLPQLAAAVREAGLDTVNAVVRYEYWVTEDGIATELPEFVKIMREEGLDVRWATMGQGPDKLVGREDLLFALAASGIKQFRGGYFRWDRKEDPREALKRARGDMETMAVVCDGYGLQCVYQVHHGTLTPSPSAVWPLVRGLPPERIGVMLDPGNQAYEGREDWLRSALLLREYLVAVGVKDVHVAHDPARAADESKGWSMEFCGIHEGMINWYDVLRALQQIDFAGTFVFMPFYHPEDPERLLAVLNQEVAYMRQVIAAVEENVENA